MGFLFVPESRSFLRNRYAESFLWLLSTEREAAAEGSRRLLQLSELTSDGEEEESGGGAQKAHR